MLDKLFVLHVNYLFLQKSSITHCPCHIRVYENFIVDTQKVARDTLNFVIM